MGLLSSIFGGGGSTTSQTTTTVSQDQRQAVQGGQAINAGGGTVQTVSKKRTAEAQSGSAAGNGVSLSSGSGDINLQMTPGPAFDLAQQSLNTLSEALSTTQQNAITSAQGATATLSKTLIQIGIPAVVLIFWLRSGKA